MTQAARNGRQTTVVVATHNEGKIVEIRSILEAAFGQLAQRIALVSAASLGLPDPVETGLTFAQNALLKAHAAARQSHMPALADDSGLVVDVLGAAPGILSARWSGTHGHDQANMDLLLGQLADIPDQGRTARFRCAAALVVPQEPTEGAGAPSDPESESESESVEFGEMPGMIAHEARGTGGFGYDPIFIPDEQPVRAGSAGRRLTSAEMTADEKNAISHRYRALHALVPAIERLLTLQA